MAFHLHIRKSRRFLTFNGQESNWQFDSWPFLGHNLCFKNPNGSCKPILNIYIQGAFQWYNELIQPMDFDPTIALWRFRNPLRLQLPKWEFTWECGGSFPHTLLHSQEHEMWLPGSLLAYIFASPCLGREPKAKVAIIIISTFYLYSEFNYIKNL
jgi:hypothetical protein